MKYLLLSITLAAMLMLALDAHNAVASEDPRYGSVIRNADGTIHRSAATISEFRSWHPCPSTGLYKGACPNFAINHIIPLSCGGLDVAWNMQWLPNDIKSCAGTHCVDRFERKINAHNPPLLDTANCTNVIVQ